MKKELTGRTPGFWRSAAFACFVGAVLAALVGTLLTTSWVLNGQLHPLWRGFGLILLMAALPILIAGGHCLDLRDRRAKELNTWHAGEQENRGRLHLVGFIGVLCLLCLGSGKVRAQQISTASSDGLARTTISAASPASHKSEAERLLLERITQLETRLAILEARLAQTPQPTKNDSDRLSNAGPNDALRLTRAENTAEQPISNTRTAGTPDEAAQFLRDTTFNLTLDGYYSYNFNRPLGGINLLRAYDVQSNSFSLNQAALVIENAPNLERGKRYGMRLDLEYGQATETVQGNAANEPRPQVYRNLWQAYGTYVFDVGNGLTVDFGKWAGSLGYETNYTKDNFNYSRSLYFNFLPFYHFGFRTKYPINDKVAVMYHLVNGAQQSEDFNGFKSHHVALILTPTKRLSGQINYYVGQEQRDRNPALNPTFAPLPTRPGLSIDVIRPVPSGCFHVLDTYYTFVLNNRWTLAIEGDYVNGRVFRESPPATVWGGAGYASYQWTPKFALRGRLEYLAEKVSSAGGLFSGVTQALKEGTFTAEYKLAEGFLVRGEYRRDWSNRPFFLTEKPGLLKREQNTATLGLIWWFGQKQGSW
jgi:hypothetical protein